MPHIAPRCTVNRDLHICAFPELVTVLQFTVGRPNASVEFADSSAAGGSATSAAALFSLPEDADAAASNVAVSSVFRVAEAADFAGVAEGYWEGKCKQFCRTY